MLVHDIVLSFNGRNRYVVWKSNNTISQLGWQSKTIINFK